MVPPADLVEWHLLNIEAFRTIQAVYDLFPKDDVEDFGTMDEFIQAVGPDLEEKYSGLEEKLSEVAVRLPEYVRQQMIEVDCLDPDIVPDDYDEPDDHGNDFESATRIAIGEAVAIELEYRHDKDVLVFLAEPGTEYVFTLYWESYSRLHSTARPIVALFDAGGQELAGLFDYGFISQNEIMWQAVTRGDYYIVVGNRVTDGSITLTVSHSTIVDGQGNDIDSATVAAATLSLDVYLTLCASTEQELADDATFGDLSSQFAAEADSLEALTPPAQLSEWHLLNIENYRTIQAVFDTQPKDDVIDFANLLIIGGAAVELEEKLGEVAARLPEDVLQQMIEAGCIDPEDVPDEDFSIESVGEDRDDHGDTPDNATNIEVGGIVEGRLEFDDVDYFRFQAEQGQSYVVSLPEWGFSSTGKPLYSDAKTITLYDSAARQLASANLSSSPYGIAWVALSSEYIYIAIGEDGTYGSYTLTVAPDDHGHDPSTATSIAIAESVEFTLYGNDTDYLRFQAEAGQDYHVYIESLTSVWGGPRVAIHDSSGLELSSFGLDEEIIVESPGSGDYYIAGPDAGAGRGAGGSGWTHRHGGCLRRRGRHLVAAGGRAPASPVCRQPAPTCPVAPVD